MRNILDNDNETWDEETPNDFENDNQLNVLFGEYRTFVEFIQNLFFRRYKDAHVVDASQPRCVQDLFTRIEKVLLRNNGVPI